MSASEKLRGKNASTGPVPELTKLKGFWRTLAEDVQGYWREQLLSSRSQADLRREIAAKFKINLKWDDQLTNFRQWLADQDKRDQQSERMQENERRLIELHPDWSLDRVREEVLRQSYFETLASGNFKLGLAAMKQDANAKALALDREKFEFDAAKAALKAASELKAIAADKTLSQADKVNQARLKLFGVEGA